MEDIAPSGVSPVKVNRWPSERPLFWIVLLAAVALWVVLVKSIVGLIYALLIGVFFFIGHVIFISHLRGSAVRLGPEQFPELYERVAALSRQIGLRSVPEAYVLQAGGTMNALATRFFRANFIVLYSDLLDACGDNTEARDFIIAHELGHLHAGHLRLRWLLLPGLFIPFLGGAYSRAREYTCDRYGMAVSRDGNAALEGLCILAAGARHGPRVNRHALVAQREAINTSWMKLGEWLSTHPPLAYRLAVLAPELVIDTARGRGAALGAAMIVALAVITPIAATFLVMTKLKPEIQAMLAQQKTHARAATTASAPAPTDLRSHAKQGILSLAQAANVLQTKRGVLPRDTDQLYHVWGVLHPGEQEPRDPYNGNRYNYRFKDKRYIIWSTGPDISDNSDDLYYASPAPAESPGAQ